jgi:hypothetical protein
MSFLRLASYSLPCRAFVHADFMHVSHDPSVMDQFLVVGKVRVADVRFGAAVKEGNVTAIDLDQFTP